MFENDNIALDTFRQKKILTLPELSKLLCCSTRTAQRRLTTWKAYTSYNHNGRYYTLPDIPQFNQHQIWQYKGIFFSKRATLQNTIPELIHESKTGLNVIELREILGMPIHNFLSQQFLRHKSCAREKYKGVYIYYSTDPTTAQTQKKARHNLFPMVTTSELPTEAEIIIILVELIKHPNDTLEQLVSRAKYRGVRIPIEKVRNLLNYHGLLKKTLGQKY